MSIHQNDPPGQTPLVVRLARPIAVAFAALIAVILVVILVVFGFGVFRGIESARSAQIQADLQTQLIMSEAFLAQYGRWPTAPNELTRPPALPDGKIPGPFLVTLPLDPFTTAPYLQGVDAQGAFFVETLGRDGLPGGSGADADIAVFSAGSPSPSLPTVPAIPATSDGEK